MLLEEYRPRSRVVPYFAGRPRPRSVALSFGTGSATIATGSARDVTVIIRVTEYQRFFI